MATNGVCVEAIMNTVNEMGSADKSALIKDLVVLFYHEQQPNNLMGTGIDRETIINAANEMESADQSALIEDLVALTSFEQQTSILMSIENGMPIHLEQ